MWNARMSICMSLEITLVTLRISPLESIPENRSTALNPWRVPLFQTDLITRSAN